VLDEPTRLKPNAKVKVIAPGADYDQSIIAARSFCFGFLSPTIPPPKSTRLVSPPYPSDDLLVVVVTSVGDALQPGEFPVEF